MNECNKQWNVGILRHYGNSSLKLVSVLVNHQIMTKLKPDSISNLLRKIVINGRRYTYAMMKQWYQQYLVWRSDHGREACFSRYEVELESNSKYEGNNTLKIRNETSKNCVICLLCSVDKISHNSLSCTGEALLYILLLLNAIVEELPCSRNINYGCNNQAAQSWPK